MQVGQPPERDGDDEQERRHDLPWPPDNHIAHPLQIAGKGELRQRLFPFGQHGLDGGDEQNGDDEGIDDARRRKHAEIAHGQQLRGQHGQKTSGGGQRRHQDGQPHAVHAADDGLLLADGMIAPGLNADMRQQMDRIGNADGQNQDRQQGRYRIDRDAGCGHRAQHP